MLCKTSLPFCLVTAFFILSCVTLALAGSDFDFPSFQTTSISGEIRNENDVLVSWGTKRLLTEDEPPLNSSLILAAKRTYRKDPLNNFNRYTGGWNISNRHYWASVAFTAAPFFVVALIWFVIFALCLLFICLCYCCCRRVPYGYSRTAYALSLILLILFTITAVVGCIILYIGQGKFHSSTVNTLDYVVHQANTTADSLRNVSGYLAAAKLIAVDQVLLPGSVQTDIDLIQTKINSSANTLASKTEDNKDDIAGLVESVRLALIILSAIMLLLTFLGFVLSIFGMQAFVYILVIFGWILVTGTLILCGIFLVLHNVTADSCVAMNQWVQHPLAHTALDDILPCVDNATAQETLTKSKEVTSKLVDVVNQVITNISNNNFSPSFRPLYYNQSGPKLPILCNPFYSDLTDRSCSPGEVDLSNATKVWDNYVCQVSPSGICSTTGRLTPVIYGQMAAAVNVSFGLYHYGPFLVDLEDCDFVRQTFGDIYSIYCPGLQRYSKWVYIGLVMVGLAVLLSLTFWVIYGRERRHRVYTKEHMPKPAEG
uniref:Putative ovule protein n=1 Tax=Solanum chacoense TaxID=4108 RepID=A0A0V0IJ62_SOLCH